VSVRTSTPNCSWYRTHTVGLLRSLRFLWERRLGGDGGALVRRGLEDACPKRRKALLIVPDRTSKVIGYCLHLPTVRSTHGNIWRMIARYAFCRVRGGTSTKPPAFLRSLYLSATCTPHTNTHKHTNTHGTHVALRHGLRLASSGVYACMVGLTAALKSNTPSR